MVHLTESTGLPLIARNRTIKIFEPTALTRTLTVSPELRSLVTSVEMSWDFKDEDECLSRLLESLTSSSSLQHLHLSPAYFRFIIPPRVLVTSLTLRIDFEEDLELVKALYDSTRLPSLRHVCFGGWISFEDGYLLETNDIETIITPNITHLTFHRSNIPGPYLQAIINMPKMLLP